MGVHERRKGRKKREEKGQKNETEDRKRKENRAEELAAKRFPFSTFPYFWSFLFCARLWGSYFFLFLLVNARAVVEPHRHAYAVFKSVFLVQKLLKILPTSIVLVRPLPNINRHRKSFYLPRLPHSSSRSISFVYFPSGSLCSSTGEESDGSQAAITELPFCRFVSVFLAICIFSSFGCRYLSCSLFPIFSPFPCLSFPSLPFPSMQPHAVDPLPTVQEREGPSMLTTRPRTDVSTMQLPFLGNLLVPFSHVTGPACE